MSTTLTKHFTKALQRINAEPATLTPGAQNLLYQVKNPCFVLCNAENIPASSVSFSRTSIIGKAACPQTEALGIANAKGFHVAWPKPSQHGPREESAFPPPDVSNKGQCKALPWWDPAVPLSSGNVNHRA